MRNIFKLLIHIICLGAMASACAPAASETLTAVTLQDTVIPSPTIEIPPAAAPTSEQTPTAKPTNTVRAKTDRSADLLKVPEKIYSPEHPDFIVASEPPTIDFSIVKMTPMYGNPYGVWGESVLGPDGAFYFTVGNHKGYGGADAFLMRYDLKTKAVENLLSTKNVCGWTDEQFGDGKLHGIPDIGPNGDLWLLTFYGPNPQKSDWGKNYFGGWLIKYNIYSGASECMGNPIGDDSWPIHTWDWERNRLYAVGEYGLYQDPASGDDPAPYPSPKYDWGKLLVYDTLSGLVLQGQYPPPDNIHWNRRSLLLDRTSGIVYGTESAAPYQFVKYDPVTNNFFRMKAKLNSAPLYSWTTQKNEDGSFFIFDQAGGFYRFFPEQDRIENLGTNWLGGVWIENMVLSPGGRYLYYISASGLTGKPTPFDTGLPVIQYDTVTLQKKVIAFLAPFYNKKYQFGLCCTYNLAISADGSTLFSAVNGDYSQAAYGQIAILVIHIPESERFEDEVK